MLRVTAVLGLLALTLANMHEGDWSRDFDTMTNAKLLEKHGFAEKGIGHDDKEAIENEDYSWEEAKGYEECEEFMFWKKDGWKKGDLEGKKKGWDGDSDGDEGRYERGGEGDQYRSENNEDNEGRRRHHHHHHGGRKGDLEGKKKEWDGKKDWKSYDFDDDDEMDEGGDEDGNDEDNEGRRIHHHHHHHHHGDPKPMPLDEICADIECPKFKKHNISGCGFEARKVLGANWTQTPIDISDLPSSFKAAYSRLRKYINGSNDQGAQLAMTAPVLIMWILDGNYQRVAGYMQFYIPSAFQSNPPTPTDAQVSIVPRCDVVMYNRAFGGHRRDAKIYTGQFKILLKALAKQDITVHPYMPLTAGYTRPGRGRQRMEVMMVDSAPDPCNLNQ